MSDPRERRELLDLLEDLCGGRLGPRQHERLQGLLKEDAEARRVYLDYLDMHLALMRLHRRASPGGGWGVAFPDRGRSDATHRPARHPFRGGTLASLGVAAAVLIALTVVLALGDRQPRPGGGWGGVAKQGRRGPQDDDRHDNMPAIGLAAVIKLDGVRWDGPPMAEGDLLTAGRVRLSSGRATLAFLNGVMLTVEGPADLELDSIDRVFCHRGRLRVRVPDGAEGFVVAAPRSSVVDLGTEFALNVEEDGKARLMVFEGEAEAAVLGAADTSERSRLVEQSKAVELDPRTGDIKEAVADTEGFVASPDPLAAPALDLDPAYPAAVLRSRPWGYWRFRSLAAGASPNEIPGGPPLRVIGPVSVADTAPGNGCAVFGAERAVRYLELDGLWELPRDPGYAVELWAMPEEYNHATLVALLPQMANRNTRHFSLLELLACGRSPFPRVASVRFLHRPPLANKGGVSVRNGTAYQLYRWHHLVAQRNGDQLELYMDGVLTRSQPLDPDRSTTPCRMLLGRLLTATQDAPEKYRPFLGRMDELALYDHPLSAEEVRSHFQLATQRVSRR